MTFFYVIFFLVGIIIGIVLFWTALERFNIFVCNKDGKKQITKKIKQIEDNGKFVYYEKN